MKQPPWPGIECISISEAPGCVYASTLTGLSTRTNDAPPTDTTAPRGL
eukprot:CAMPEP_0197665796 /NCGR_PEP_ID=MMETSP1338-20131121/60518_1 /TAXON_ID=43686 ORGANISM="Pelagodinium beii, Strain RCC1491" /NCGR_SAMPLE_ID=MMETSP1338 /ASSEMBLY_ACC=CAM_ASM_000754 /LENGTH=47 /DNA_ID= /DNA_START= /DNA_END= /DNA_ORIENTATION=